MRKINREMLLVWKEACKEACKDAHVVESKTSTATIKRKQNREIVVTTIQDYAETYACVAYYFHGNRVAYYQTNSDICYFNYCGHEKSPTTRAIIKSLRPQHNELLVVSNYLKQLEQL